MKGRVIVACLAMTLGLASRSSAQSVGPAFEVASVRPSNPDAVDQTLPPVAGRFTASNAPLRRLIQMAYDVYDLQIVGGPEWQSSRRFDIQAKAADALVGMEAMRPMLKELLADRFQLKVHTEARPMPIYALVVSSSDDQLGAKIRRSTTDCSTAEQDLAKARAKDPGTVADRLAAGQGLPCAIMPAPARLPGSMTMRANGASMADLARFLTPFTGRMVQDRTSLNGRYDWEMTFERALRPPTAQQPVNTAPSVTPPPSESPSLTTALKEQLGLKLESTRGVVEMLVIDSAVLPKAD